MSDIDRIDLEALRPEAGERGRVIAGAMARVRAGETGLEPAPDGWVRAALAGSATFLRPVLAAAAVIFLVLALSGDPVPPDTRAAGVLLSATGGAPDNLLRWSVGGETADPTEILVTYAEPTP